MRWSAKEGTSVGRKGIKREENSWRERKEYEEDGKILLRYSVRRKYEARTPKEPDDLHNIPR